MDNAQNTLQDQEPDVPESLHDTLSAAFDEHVEQESTAPSAPVTKADEGVKADAVIGDTQEQADERAGRTAGRQRDAQGRLLPGKAAAPVAAPVTPPVEAVAPAEPFVKPADVPKGWKKEHFEYFNKIKAENPALAEFLVKRESDFASGVSTYRAEAERAKGIMSAIEPFMPDLQRNNIQPQQWISDLGRAHQQLALGSPQQKLQMFQRLAQDYGVPLQALLPTQDGQPAPVDQTVLQYINPLHEQLRQVQGQLHNYQTMQEKQQQDQLQSEISRFSEGKEHFAEVRETMAGLLQSGLAPDLQSAYDAAIRMPQHDDIFQAMQQQQREAEAQRQANEQREAAVRARSKTVSPRSGVPTIAKEKSNGSGVRDSIAAAFDAVESGRV